MGAMIYCWCTVHYYCQEEGAPRIICLDASAIVHVKFLRQTVHHMFVVEDDNLFIGQRHGHKLTSPGRNFHQLRAHNVGRHLLLPNHFAFGVETNQLFVHCSNQDCLFSSHQPHCLKKSFKINLSRANFLFVWSHLGCCCCCTCFTAMQHLYGKI